MMMDSWMWMHGYGFGHWVFFAVMVAVVLYPVGRILRRLGLSPFWSVLALIPFVNLISLWVLAFSEWPGATGRGEARPA
jgi:predicted PurR-regulated permease PerM